MDGTDAQRPQHGISQHTTDLIHKVFGTDLTQLLLEHLPEASPTLRYGILTALANQNQVIPLQELVKGNFSHDPALKHATARALFDSLTSGEFSWEQVEGLPPLEKQLAMGELGLKVLDEHLVSYLDSTDIHVRFALADGLYRQGSAGSMQMLVSWAKGFLSNSSSLEKSHPTVKPIPPYPRLSGAEFLQPAWRPKIVMPFTASSCYSTNLAYRPHSVRILRAGCGSS